MYIPIRTDQVCLASNLQWLPDPSMIHHPPSPLHFYDGSGRTSLFRTHSSEYRQISQAIANSFAVMNQAPHLRKGRALTAYSLIKVWIRTGFGSVIGITLQMSALVGCLASACYYEVSAVHCWYSSFSMLAKYWDGCSPCTCTSFCNSDIAAQRSCLQILASVSA